MMMMMCITECSARLSADSVVGMKQHRLVRQHTEESHHQPGLLMSLFQARSSDSDVMAFLSYVTKYMQLHNMSLPIHFAPDHPVEEAGR